MFEIEKDRLGAFIAAQRKIRGYTQKELAQRLYVSDKAVSKWERGQSMPDISLLLPLADCLGVTVTELLEGRRMEEPAIPAGQVEELLKKTLHFSEREAERDMGISRRFFVLLAAALVVLGETLLYISLGAWGSDLVMLFTGGSLFFSVMALGFGVYFWLFAPMRIPNYYDENRINAYSHGVFRMNLPGVAINNSNWSHILRAGRWWSILGAVLPPLLDMAGSLWFPGIWYPAGRWVLLALYLSGLFVPIYVAAKRYE